MEVLLYQMMEDLDSINSSEQNKMQHVLLVLNQDKGFKVK